MAVLAGGCALLICASTLALALGWFAVSGVGFGRAMTGLTTVVQERGPAFTLAGALILVTAALCRPSALAGDRDGRLLLSLRRRLGRGKQPKRPQIDKRVDHPAFIGGQDVMLGQ